MALHTVVSILFAGLRGGFRAYHRAGRNVPGISRAQLAREARAKGVARGLRGERLRAYVIDAVAGRSACIQRKYRQYFAQEMRRIFQRELRRASPVRTRALKRSIRVYTRDGVDPDAVRMKFYGRFLNNFKGKHHSWIDDAADRVLRRSPHASRVAAAKARRICP